HFVFGGRAFGARLDIEQHVAGPGGQLTAKVNDLVHVLRIGEDEELEQRNAARPEQVAVVVVAGRGIEGEARGRRAGCTVFSNGDDVELFSLLLGGGRCECAEQGQRKESAEAPRKGAFVG